MTTTNHSWAATRAAERRESRALDARLAREAADAAAQRRIAEQDARRDRDRADRESAERRRTEQRRARTAARAAARTRALTWSSAHVVELLIYPIALLSFALAAPAMAAYGTTIYGPLGVLLAGITELGMWAFALAIVASRHQTPDRPVVGLQAGVVLFSLVAASMNLLHGLEQGLTAGIVMAVVSIAGVTAHQLTLAGAPRSRAERRDAHLTALVEAKTDRARRLAVRDAAATIGTDGTAQLTYRPGTYQVHRRALAATTAPGRHGAPPVPGGEGRADDWDWALAALVEGADCVGSASPTTTTTTSTTSTPTSTMIMEAVSPSSTAATRSRVGSRGLTCDSRPHQDHRRGAESTPTMILKPGRLPAAWMIFATSSGPPSPTAGSTPDRPSPSAGRCAVPPRGPANSATRPPEAPDEQQRPRHAGKSGGASPDHHARELAPVITLHHRTDNSDTEPSVVIEGEIVDHTCGPQTDSASTPGTDVVVSRRDLYRSDLHTAGRSALAAATHPVTVTTTKALVRNTWFVFSGAGVLIQRWRDTHGTSRYERQMRAAEIAGDQDRLLEWEARDTAEKQRRHGRVMDWINAPLAWARAAGVGALIALGMLLALGAVLAIAAKDVSLVIAPVAGVIDAVAWTVTFVTVYATVIATLAGAGAVLGLWALGAGPHHPTHLDRDCRRRRDQHRAGCDRRRKRRGQRAAQPRPERPEQQVQTRLDTPLEPPTRPRREGLALPVPPARGRHRRDAQQAQRRPGPQPPEVAGGGVAHRSPRPPRHAGPVGRRPRLTHQTGRALAAAARRDHRLLPWCPRRRHPPR
ncbi:hypothetical protein [Pseudonocardia sp. ICBG601]|uniref:hypothetical protein n=1 Tax=Pseudonocardia sp. ICBG601 TaxID=2846759 RepID=UPI001CF69F89|nr:hypothetical protein [Pseudonocardia sp. ICBG601]